MSFKDDPAWQAEVHFERLEKEHDIAMKSLVEFLMKLGCGREEARSIIAEADQMIRYDEEF